jgi:hypothetical protein
MRIVIMNQSKIPFAYKTASWVAVGLVVSAGFVAQMAKD